MNTGSSVLSSSYYVHVKSVNLRSNLIQYFFETNQQATVVINIIAKYIRTPILEYKNRASDVVKINIVHDRLNNKKTEIILP